MSENPSENVFELISNNYYELTASEKKIADYIIAVNWDMTGSTQ